MNKAFFLIISAICFSSPVFACMVAAKKLNLTNTSLEKNPILIRGSSIYFDEGTNDELHFKYNPELKKWCVINSNPAKPNCDLAATNHITNSKGEKYADIILKENRLKVYPLKKDGVRGSTFITFEDLSEPKFERVEITSSFGSKIMVSLPLGLRGGLPKIGKDDILDLSKEISGTIGCGSGTSLQNKTETSR